jgi:hypothetical protein
LRLPLLNPADPLCSDSNTMVQPQASATVQPPSQQPPTFSNSMSYDQLALWLTNHPKLVGVGYQQDINKLKGIQVHTFTHIV